MSETLRETNSQTHPENIGRLTQKERKIVSQPAFFRGKLAVRFRECSLSPFLFGGGGPKSPRRFKPPPKVLGWFHVAAGYHIIGDYAVGHWVLRWFHGQFFFLTWRKWWKNNSLTLWNMYIYIYTLYYISIHSYTWADWKVVQEVKCACLGEISRFGGLPKCRTNIDDCKY